jgi:hypothetical protein
MLSDKVSIVTGGGALDGSRAWSRVRRGRVSYPVFAEMWKALQSPTEADTKM